MVSHRLTEPHVKFVQVEETPRENGWANIIACVLIVKIATILTIWILYFHS